MDAAVTKRRWVYAVGDMRFGDYFPASGTSAHDFTFVPLAVMAFSSVSSEQFRNRARCRALETTDLAVFVQRSWLLLLPRGGGEHGLMNGLSVLRSPLLNR